jgi:hypothetical protein
MVRSAAAALVLAASSATLASQGLVRVTPLGPTAVPAGSGLASVNDDLHSAIPNRGEFDVHAFLTGGSTPGHALPTTAPSAPGLSTALVNGGFYGFNGLNHFDQRTAGTGRYTNTQFNLEPPDQALCVGNGFVVESVNTALAIYGENGVRRAGPVALNQFFGLAPEINRTTLTRGDFTSDPRCWFDWQGGHFYLVILQIDPPPGVRASILLAVSQTANPMGSWNIFKIDATNDGNNGTPSHPGCPCLGDQPLLGADANAIFITTNEFGATVFNGAQVYAIGKSLLNGGTGSAVFFDNLPLAEDVSYSIQPATTPPGGQFALGSGGTEFFASALDFTGTLDDRIAVWAMTGTRSLNTSNPKVTFASKVIASETYGMPPDAEQKDGPTPLRALLNSTEGPGFEKLALLQTNDDRMQQAVYNDGKLWTALTTVLRPVGDSRVRAGAAWFVVAVEAQDDEIQAELEKQGYVSSRGAYAFFPSVAVTRDNEAVIAFSLSGTQLFPSAAYVRLRGEGASSIHLAAAGAAPEDGFTGYIGFGGNGHARWGDYSAAVAAPDGSIWFANEYISGGPRTLLANWATFISRIAPRDEGGE